MTSQSPAARRRRRAGRITAWFLGGILTAAVAAAAWIGVRGYLAYQHLDAARAAADGATDVLADPAEASDLIADIASETSAASALTSDPIWKLGEALPWVGPQLAAVGTVAASLDDLASEALTPLASVAASFSFDSIRPQNGAIDPAAFTSLEAAASTGADGLGAARSAVAAIDEAPLVGPLRDAVDEVSTLLDETYSAADALRRTTELLPAMLGADGPRDYVIVFQNNAEWRSLGGIVGALAQVRTHNGALSLVTQASSSDFPHYDEPVVPLTDDEIRLFGEQPATFVQNVTQLPDFTRDAPIVQAMWERETGTTVDGVLALDPVAVSYLLEATGPIALPTGDELSAENAVSLLLNEVYLRYEDPAEQDLFFAAATSSVFARIASGGVDPAAFAAALGRAGAENRMLLWNADPAEQAVLDGTTLQGTLDDEDPDTTTFGVYANDGTSSKMDYYMSLDTATAWCGEEAALTVTLTNDAPADAASLPSYVTGGGKHGVAPGSVETVVYVYLPEGSALQSSEASGTGFSPDLGGGTDAGRQVLSWAPVLAPGESTTLDVRVRTSLTEHLVTRTTPTVNANPGNQLAISCDIPE
ncbi:DUF4012 domain-containing protein [Microbacterium sp. NPDC055903]